MEAIGQLTGRALTGTRRLQTQKPAVNTQAWAKWAAFDLRGNEETRSQLASMVDATARFCRDIKEDQSPRWLSLLGSSAAGKTYLAKRIWRWHRYGDRFRATMARGHDGKDEVVYPGQWCYWPDLAGELSGNRGYDRVDELMREKFVVLDEIGADRDPHGHVRDCLARILCSRVGKWTIVTSNKTLQQISEDIDTRIASRMIRDGSEAVCVRVPDYFLDK